MFPLFHSVRLVDTGDQTAHCQSVLAVTEDNLAVSADAAITYHVVDPEAALYKVASYSEALTTLLESALQTGLGQATAAEVCGAHSTLDASRLTHVASGAGGWGIAVTSARIGKIDVRA